MIRPCFKLWLSVLVAVCAWLLLATAGNAENRARPAETAPMKAKPRAKGADSPTEAKSADKSSPARDDDSLADDDSPKAKSGSKATVKKKSAGKGTKDSKPAAKKPAGRSRDADATGQQVLVGTDLNLEPET